MEVDGALDDDVLELLSGLIAFKNKADAKGWRDAFENMPVYLERLGLTEDIKTLKVIHVAGTKGKGSTCAMIDSILRQAGYKTGLFTSPHLVDVRERMRISGKMVSKEVFEDHFWASYNKFKSSATEDVGIPGYFRFLTLMALRLFIVQKVDVVILEVGIGGRLDATNIIPNPVVTGVTSLGFDHMEMLGDTLPKIAREKAGIFKKGCPAFTLPQPEDAMEALKEVAERNGAMLQQVPDLGTWTPEDPEYAISVALGGSHQELNASMAVQLCHSFEAHQLQAGVAAPGAESRVKALKAGRLPEEYLKGLACTEWPGRSQIISDPEFLELPINSPSSSRESLPLNSTLPSTPSAFNGTVTANQCSDQGNGQLHVHGSQQAVVAHVSYGGGGERDSVGSRLSFYIDGAHTPESMVTCAEWFAASAASQVLSSGSGVSEVQRMLLFNCMKERDPSVLLPALASSLASSGCPMHHSFFVLPESQYGFLQTKKHPLPPSMSAQLNGALHGEETQNGSNGSQATSGGHGDNGTLKSMEADVRSGLTEGSSSQLQGQGESYPVSNGVSHAVIPGVDCSWQMGMQHVWEGTCLGILANAGAGTGSPPSGLPATPKAGNLFPLQLPPVSGLAMQDSLRGAVSPSLAATLAALRSAVRSRPQLQLQVLVTGSLYLVGDMLKLLGRAPR